MFSHDVAQFSNNLSSFREGRFINYWDEFWLQILYHKRSISSSELLEPIRLSTCSLPVGSIITALSAAKMHLLWSLPLVYQKKNLRVGPANPSFGVTWTIDSISVASHTKRRISGANRSSLLLVWQRQRSLTRIFATHDWYFPLKSSQDQPLIMNKFSSICFCSDYKSSLQSYSGNLTNLGKIPKGPENLDILLSSEYPDPDGKIAKMVCFNKLCMR